MSEEVNVQYEYFHRSKDAPLILYFSGWDVKLWYQRPIFTSLKRNGFNVLAFSYTRNLLQPHPDPVDHLERFKSGYENIIKVADTYVDRINNVGIIGTSIGSSLGFIAGAHYSQKVSHVVLNLFVSDFAEGLWSWKGNMYRLLTSDFKYHISNRENYEKNGNTIDDAKRVWKFMNLPSHLDKYNKNKTKFLLYSAKGDLLSPFSQSEGLVNALDTNGFTYKHDVKGERWGHFTAGIWNTIRYKKWVNFLKE